LSKDLNLNKAVKGIEKFLQRQASKEVWAEVTVSVAPNLFSDKYHGTNVILDEEISIQVLKKDKKTIERLSLLHWYLQDDIRFYLNIELQNIARQQQFARSIILLESKSLAIIYALQMYIDNPRFFFGRFLDKRAYQLLPESIKVTRKKQPHVRIPEVARIGVGYKDKGHLPNLALGGALSKVYNKPLQQKIEENRQNLENTIQILLGFYQ